MSEQFLYFSLDNHILLDRPSSNSSIGNFLKSTPRLSKKRIGEFLAIRGNEEALDGFFRTFSFHEVFQVAEGLFLPYKGTGFIRINLQKRIDFALREVLESFRLPGESQLIERIMEAFAHHYFQQNAEEGGQFQWDSRFDCRFTYMYILGVFANEDAVFVLSYSVIMLNTDQHNRQIRVSFEIYLLVETNSEDRFTHSVRWISLVFCEICVVKTTALISRPIIW